MLLTKRDVIHRFGFKHLSVNQDTSVFRLLSYSFTYFVRVLYFRPYIGAIVNAGHSDTLETGSLFNVPNPHSALRTGVYNVA